jgi:hypothetical protein
MAARPRRSASALAGVVVVCLASGCVDKAPPPLWPAPPPPSVAELLGSPAQPRPAQPAAPSSVAVGATALTGPPSPLDAVKVDKASILDPEGPAATEAAQANPPTSPRPVPTHR